MRFELTILGTSAALPAYNRFPSAQILNIQDQLFLIDCGEGTQMRMMEFGVKKNRIEQIFISHLHGDHVYGLIGLLTSFGLNNRTNPLTIFSPPGLEEIINIQFKYTGGQNSPFPIHFKVLDPTQSETIFDNDLLSVTTLPLLHRIPTVGYLFREKEHPRNILPEKIRAYQIPYTSIPAIKNGEDFQNLNGQIIPNTELTLAPRVPRTFAYCSDTAFNEALIPLIEGVDLLYHESTFCEDHQEQAKITMHSTAKQAATIAAKAKAGQLILGHYSARYKVLDCFLEEAQAIFSNTLLGKEGMVYEVLLKRMKEIDF